MTTSFKLFFFTMLLGVFGSQHLFSQAVGINRTPEHKVIAKSYYFTNILYENPGLVKEILRNPGIKKIAFERQQRFVESKNCQDKNCYLDAFKWTDAEIHEISTAFQKQYEQNSIFKNKIKSDKKLHLMYGLSEIDNELVRKATIQDYISMNNVIDIYGGGKLPNYPRIDSISFNVKDKKYPILLDGVRQELLTEPVIIDNPLSITMQSANRLLEINERLDVAQLVPMQELENKNAVQKIKLTDFNKYPYTAILTLGAGPEEKGQKISPMGMLRARTAANYYFDGKAPFIIVSGGRVHPYKTTFVEAVEMKKYLVNPLLVPENAVIIEPLARHTTTNYRNAARLMLQYGFPKILMAVATSSSWHLDDVEKMEPRLLKELGYMPYKPGRRISETLLEFLPLESAFRIDPDEPLDP